MRERRQGVTPHACLRLCQPHDAREVLLRDLDGLVRGRPARVADLSCGDGRLALELAALHPAVRVDGWDVDDGRVAVARRAAIERDVDDRVTFEVWPPRPGHEAAYDAIVALTRMENTDDGPRLVSAARALVKPHGLAVLQARSDLPQLAALARQAGFLVEAGPPAVEPALRR